MSSILILRLCMSSAMSSLGVNGVDFFLFCLLWPVQKIILYISKRIVFFPKKACRPFIYSNQKSKFFLYIKSLFGARKKHKMCVFLFKKKNQVIQSDSVKFHFFNKSWSFVFLPILLCSFPEMLSSLVIHPDSVKFPFFN